jgi:cbb3-type cytochrome oxidase subunit 1
MVSRFIKQAVVWFVLAIAIGIYMAIGHDFALIPVHAHVNLLGWVSMTLFALIYRTWPRMQASRLATIHFWLHSLGVPIAMIGVTRLVLSRSSGDDPLAAIGSIMILIGAILFLVRVFAVVSESERPTAG